MINKRDIILFALGWVHGYFSALLFNYFPVQKNTRFVIHSNNNNHNHDGYLHRNPSNKLNSAAPPLLRGSLPVCNNRHFPVAASAKMESSKNQYESLSSIDEDDSTSNKCTNFYDIYGPEVYIS